MIDSGLVTQEGEWPRLTSAGIEMCKSLQHRLAADTQAAKIIEKRDASDANEVASGQEHATRIIREA